MNNVSEGVEADPNIMHGKPVIEGTRIPIDVVLNTLADGVGIEEVCEEFSLDEEQVLNAVRYAANRVSHEEYRALEA